MSPRLGPDELLAARAWHRAVVRGRCIMCAVFPLGVQERRSRAPELRFKQGHHVIAKRHLRRYGHADRVWDARNGVCVCELHHQRHENYTQRIPRALLPAAVAEFALDVDLLWLLDTEYPTETAVL